MIGKDSRPVRNASQAVTVKYGLGLIQMDLDEKEKILSMSMWSRYVRYVNVLVCLHESVT